MCPIVTMMLQVGWVGELHSEYEANIYNYIYIYDIWNLYV